MAKKRIEVGSVRKNDKGGFYIKVNTDINLKKGQSLSLYSKADQLASLEENREKMSAEGYEKAKERIEKIPDFIKFEILKFE